MEWIFEPLVSTVLTGILASTLAVFIQQRQEQKELRLQAQEFQKAYLSHLKIIERREIEREKNYAAISEASLDWSDENRTALKFLSEPGHVKRMIIHEMAIAELIEETFEELKTEGFAQTEGTEFDVEQRVTAKAIKFSKREDKKGSFVENTKKKIQAMINARMKAGIRNIFGDSEGGDEENDNKVG